jgi:hypothetical protein
VHGPLRSVGVAIDPHAMRGAAVDRYLEAPDQGVGLLAGHEEGLVSNGSAGMLPQEVDLVRGFASQVVSRK